MEINKEINKGQAPNGGAADKGWGRPLATVAAGQKNGGNYQFDQVYVDNGIVTIVEAKAGVSVTPSKSSHKIGDERFEQGHHNHTQSTIRHMQERYRNTRDPNLQITLDAMKDAIDNGQLRFKVVHQRIDSNGSLGKLSVTEYDQSEVVFPQSRSF
ncbi:hypothetical protein [Vibrio caribbeanicus]|uniref:hypothetical protein n=1 Tax=Vibrio caribbeanicus TaxID=701175 RepID=UPI00228375F5|nr:hypothetical protein [Vibrio caribbeanicus]MCY9844847.1 hypothetical protein [Vibrio caribbeanicus]